MRYLVCAVAMLAIAGCAGTTPQVSTPVVTSAPVSDPLAGLKAFTIADLQAALADANAQVPPDQTSAQCYAFLIAALPNLPSFQPGSPVGAVLAFQKLRDLQNGVSSSQGALKSLNLACAPLVIDTQTVINKLLLISAGTAATGGSLAPFAGALPVIGAALPIPLQ